MSISRVKSAGWSVNEKLTSAQITRVDANTSYALDKRSGQTDALSSVVTVASGGQISFASGSSITSVAGSSFSFAGSTSFAGANTFGLLSTATFSGVAAFSNSSAVTFGSGTVAFSNTILSGTAIANSLHIGNTSLVLFDSGSSLLLGGYTNIIADALNWNCNTNVTFGHIDNVTNGAIGVQTTISGQNTTGTASVGGDLILKTGEGVGANGSLYLKGGSGMVAAFDNSFSRFYSETIFQGAQYYSLARTVAYASSLTIDMSAGNVVVVGTLTGNVTITCTNVRDGGIYTFYLTEDATGGRTIAFFHTGGGSTYYGSQASNLNTGANKVNVYQFLGRVISGVPYFYCLSLTSV